MEDELTPAELLAGMLQEQAELANQNSNNNNNNNNHNNNNNNNNNNNKGKKKNRAKERLAKRDAKLKALEIEERENIKNKPNERDIEIKEIEEICRKINKKIIDIQPDGNCLYSAISDQLLVRSSIHKTVKDLRNEVANYLLSNYLEFKPYLIDEKTGQDIQIETYCNDIKNNTLWGGDLEIMILSKIYNSPITVVIANQNQIPHVFNKDFKNPHFYIVYYKHYYALGQHYNSLHDL